MKKRFVILIVLVLIPVMLLTGCGESGAYKNAMSLYEDGKYHENGMKFIELGDYENSKEMVKTCKYEEAKALFDAGDLEAALDAFREISGYNDTDTRIAEIKNELMHQQYGGVFDALAGKTWFFNGGSDTILNGISFEGDMAKIAQVYFDGNGKQDNGSTEHSYSVDDQFINVTMEDGSELQISYVLSGDKIVLGNNEYFSLEEIDAGLQGYWKMRKSETILGVKTVTEHNIHINNGDLYYERAALAAGGTNGEYYYYGPYQGTYTLNFGGFDTDMMHGNEWFFNIINGKVILLHFDSVCTPTDKLPGEDGYKF